MWVAELAQAIPPELGGGRRNHRPIELVLNYVLLNDVVRQKRKAIGIGSTDFLGCFDRLVHIIALLCLRLFGMPHAPVQSMIEAIQTMTHLIRTAFGDSTEGYNPIQPATLTPAFFKAMPQQWLATLWQSLSLCR